MKKYITSAICVILLLNSIFLWNETVKAEGIFEMTSTATSLQAGDVVSVDLYVRDMAICYWSGYLEYDLDVFEELTVSDIELPDELVDEGWGKTWASSVNKMSVSAMSGDAIDLPEDGFLARINLRVKTSTESTTIKLTNVAVVDENTQDCELGNGEVSIRDASATCELGIKINGSMPESLKAGEQYALDVYFTKATDVDTLFFVLNFDDEVFSVCEDEVQGMSNWEITSNTSGNEFVASLSGSATSEDAGEVIARILLEVKKDVASTSVQLTDINPAYMGQDYYLDGVTEVLQIGGIDADVIVPEGVFELVVEEGSYAVGDIVEVKLYVHDYHILGIQMGFDYDDDVFYSPDYGEDIIFNETYDDGSRASWSVTASDEYMVLTADNGTGGVFSQDGYVFTLPLKVKQPFQKTNIEAIEIYVSLPDGSDEDNVDEIAYVNKLSCTLTGNGGVSGNQVALSMDAAQTKAGAEVTLPLNITTNTGFNALGVTITYDESICSYNDLTVSDEFADKIALQSVYKVPGEGKIKASFIASENITDLGAFANLSLSVNSGVVDGTSSNISVEIEQVTNKEETTVTGNGSTATLTVGEKTVGDTYLLGDVNEDGSINLTDAVYILLAYNGEKTLTSAQNMAADTTKDGSVNLLDALQIMKYFNGEIQAF